MKKGLIQIVLAFLISFFIPMLSAYLDYCDLREADFLPYNICFENPDQGNLSISQDQESKANLANASVMRSLPGIDFLKLFPFFSFLNHSLDPTFILRC